jgi:hypothetical protein
LAEAGRRTTDHRLFSLAPRVLELSYGYLSGLGMTDIAGARMEERIASVQESSSIAGAAGRPVPRRPAGIPTVDRINPDLRTVGVAAGGVRLH